MKDVTNETDIRKAVLVAVSKKYQKFNDKNPTGQEILDRALMRYDPVSDEFHPNDLGWIDSQQAYFKLDSARLKIDPAAFDELCEGGAPSASNVVPMTSPTPSNEIIDKDLLEHHLTEIGAIIKRLN
jgi:hypothetical protein